MSICAQADRSPRMISLSLLTLGADGLMHDLKGNVLVGVGWQDICTKFAQGSSRNLQTLLGKRHKVISGQCCPGEFKPYKVQEQHVGHSDSHHGGWPAHWHIFSGQFFFEGESLDYELFRSQARR